uniref:Carcinoembryonic antigen-related cell adhesion molecule 23 n=1 Tax=Canis lupus familiaris TaxID=9615 RepID=A0A8C0SMI2_CANLF
MEPPSASPRAGRGPWQELLLAVSLLISWNPLTTAQVTVESVPPNAAEGKDALLRVLNLPGDTAGLTWFRGEIVAPVHQIVLYVVDTRVITPGPAHSGREIIYPNGSLLFQNITLSDTGSYILQIINRKFETALVTGELRVFPELHKPSITSNNSSPVENADSVVLMCEAQTQSTSCLWSVNTKSLPDSPRLELSLDNRTLTVHGVTRNDTGPYECETRNPVSADRSDPFTLNVLYGPDTPTISPSDSYYRLGANLSLSCHTASNPPAQYSWLINGRLPPFTQELFIPNITANDSGSYTCLVYNSGTCLNKTTVKTITVSEPVPKPSLWVTNFTVTENKDSVVLTCSTSNAGVSIQWFLNGQNLKLMERRNLSQGNSNLTIHPVKREDSGNYQCEVANPVSSSKSDPIKLDVIYERSTTGLPVRSIIGTALGVLLGIALTASLGCLLLCTKTGRASAWHDLRQLWHPASTPCEYLFIMGGTGSPEFFHSVHSASHPTPEPLTLSLGFSTGDLHWVYSLEI